MSKIDETIVATKAAPRRVPTMRALKIANGIYRELVKAKEKNLLSFEELQGHVENAMADIKAECEAPSA